MASELQQSGSLIATALPSRLGWSARPSAAELAAAPARPAVYLLEDELERPVFLGMTQDLRRVLRARMAEAVEPTRRADVAAVSRGVRWREAHSAFESRLWYWRLARTVHPHDYRERLDFGPAWFLTVDLESRAALIDVTERVWRVPGAFAGPFPTRRDAQATLDGLRDLFDLCRHPEEVARAPGGRRCAYYDMGRCDAPCDGTAPLAPYAQRTREAWRFVTGGCAAWIESATERMRDAAAAQRFEAAAQLKQQIAFARGWQSRSDGRIEAMERVRRLLAIPVARRKSWMLFYFHDGMITPGPTARSAALTEAAAAWVSSVQSAAAPREDAAARMEQTWLYAHFLGSREASDSLVLAVGETPPPANWPALQSWLESREKAPGNAAENSKEI